MRENREKGRLFSWDPTIARYMHGSVMFLGKVSRELGSGTSSIPQAYPLRYF
jgi:hypothetical protein